MNSSPNPDSILEMIGAFRRSKTMFTAVRLGIFDELEKGSQTASQLASTLKLNAGAAARLLDGCVALELLRHAGDKYENTPAASRYLTSTSPDTLAGYIVYSNQSLFYLWAHLEDAVREGSNRWEQVFGSRSSLFDHYFRDESSTASFLAGMNGFGQIASPLIVSAFNLSRFRHLVDLGGATGHLAIAACEAYPQLEATVLDLPHVEKFARAHIERSAASGRVQFVVGDFFSGDFPSADLYALGRILHDWSEEKMLPLLSKIARSLPSAGALLITETLVDDDRSGPVYTLMQDLNMLVCTDGKERTAAEYEQLLRSAGFSRVEFRRTGSLVDAILATKD